MENKVTIDLILSTIQEWIENHHAISPAVWVESAMKLNALLGNFDEELIKAEISYREIVNSFILGGETNANAEAKAKVTPEYATYRKLSMKKKQIEELIRLAKKRSVIQDF